MSTQALIDRHLDDGSLAHYAALMTPEPQRHGAAALLAFDSEMRALPTVSRDVAPTKLHWWHEELDRFARGEPRHPLTLALVPWRGEAMSEALNARLHGAVVDFNEADISNADFDRYLHMRSGALFDALALAAAREPGGADRAAGEVCAVADLMRESRDPAFAEVPVASLRALVVDEGESMSDDDIETALNAALAARRDAALARLEGAAPASLTGAVLLALYKEEWPRIIRARTGAAARPTPPWQRLWTSWRAARRYR